MVVKMTAPTPTVKAAKLDIPPGTTRLCHDEASDMKGPQKIPKPVYRNMIKKSLPSTVGSDGQISPYPTLKGKRGAGIRRAGGKNAHSDAVVPLALASILRHPLALTTYVAKLMTAQ